MKKILFPALYALLPCLVFAGSTPSIPGPGDRGYGSAPSYEMMETFDPVGYLISGWTESAGAPDEDYTTTVLSGAQSLYMATGSTITHTFSARNTLSVFQLVRFNVLPASSDSSLIIIRDSGATARCQFRMDVGGTVQARYGTINGPNTATAMSANQTYCMWTDFDKSGSCSIGFDLAATCIKPTSGNQFSTATGTATNQAVSIDILSSGTSTALIYDNVYYDTNAIGSNP